MAAIHCEPVAKLVNNKLQLVGGEWMNGDTRMAAVEGAGNGIEVDLALVVSLARDPPDGLVTFDLPAALGTGRLIAHDRFIAALRSLARKRRVFGEIHEGASTAAYDEARLLQEAFLSERGWKQWVDVVRRDIDTYEIVVVEWVEWRAHVLNLAATFPRGIHVQGRFVSTVFDRSTRCRSD